jgi:hypothetical protein
MIGMEAHEVNHGSGKAISDIFWKGENMRLALYCVIMSLVVICNSGCEESYYAPSAYSPPLPMQTNASLVQPPVIPSPAPEPLGAFNVSRYDPASLANPYGAGNPYKGDGLMNPYSLYGSPYSNKSWTNPYATDAPKLYDSQGNYRGKLSTNRFDPDSVSNPYGKYGNPLSPDSIRNPYGTGNPYSNRRIYVMPSK